MLMGPAGARAAEAGGGLDGASLSALWALPFCGILLSIAVGPLLFARWWHPHYGKTALFWAFLVVAPLAWLHGLGTTAQALFQMLALDYIPFILMLFALFTTTGGLVVRGNLHGSPLLNTGLLFVSAILASLIGTTGASMIMVRPLLRANDNRRHNAHIFVFLIFLSANIGGALTPLGNPPLFLGFIHGVDFAWPLLHLIPATGLTVGLLLAVFLAIDTWFYRREGILPNDPTPDSALALSGRINLTLIAVAVGAIVLSGVWKPGMGLELFGARIELQNIARECVMLGVGLASIVLTKAKDRAANGFAWEPLIEVGKLFAAIFVCMIPLMAMLQAGAVGAFAPLVALVTQPGGAPNDPAYFWMTGILSSFLDNAPTYLAFFELAGGDPAVLMTQHASTLAAISLGASFMGANTYIGNAPNFMVYAIARDAGVRMPGFFAYMLWSGCILLPLFGLLTWTFLR
jgi:Na+/H+ antiporter NhaD/arsenite permease-like protein